MKNNEIENTNNNNDNKNDNDSDGKKSAELESLYSSKIVEFIKSPVECILDWVALIVWSPIVY